jgi:transposase
MHKLEARMNKRDIRFSGPKVPRHQMILYPQSLDQVITQNAPVRRLAALLDEIDWSTWEQAYTGWGQPPIHPRYMAGAILFGLLHKVLSTRELEEAARKDVDFIWLFEGHAPDHSTFAEFRKRHGDAIAELHKHIAKMLVMKREKALLHLIINGTRLRADSDRQGARTAKAIEFVIGELQRRMDELRRNDTQETAHQTAHFDNMEPPQDEEDKLAWLDQNIAKLEKKKAKYQKALDKAHERDARAQKHNGKKAKPARVPVTDPDARVAPNKEGGFAPNYTPIATVESQTGAIVHAGVLDGSDEANAVLPAIKAGEALTEKKADAVLADGNFAAGEVLEALDVDGIEAYMPTRSASPPDNPAVRSDPTTPVAEQDRRRLPRYGKQYARTAFVYDVKTDVYYCPMGHALTPYKHGKNNEVRCTYYQRKACIGCPLAPDCIKGKSKLRSIARDQYELHREATNQRMATEEGKAIYRTRAPGIESVFGIIKSCLGIRRFSRRGLSNVRCDWTWICTAYNLKKILTLKVGTPDREPRAKKSGNRRPEQRLYASNRNVVSNFWPKGIQYRILDAPKKLKCA